MTDLELIRHQLICVLAVRLAEVLVKLDAVADGQASVDAIYQ